MKVTFVLILGSTDSLADPKFLMMKELHVTLDDRRGWRFVRLEGIHLLRFNNHLNGFLYPAIKKKKKTLKISFFERREDYRYYQKISENI